MIARCGLSRRLRALLAPVVVFLAAAATCHAEDTPADWPELSAGERFTLRAPPGSRLVFGPPEDSLVGVLELPDAQLQFDYGAYSDPLEQGQHDQDYRTQKVEFGGREAQIVTAHAPQRSPTRPYLIGIHFPTVEQSALGPIKLTISGFVKSTNDYRLIKRVLSTIRFPSAKDSRTD